MDRNGLQTVQNASKPHFSRTHKTAKRGQNVPNFDQKGLSQGPHVACKCWLCTLPACASNYFFISVGWVGGFPAHDLGDCSPSIVVARQSSLVSGVVHMLWSASLHKLPGTQRSAQTHTRASNLLYHLLLLYI